jgi:hypothetical protein
MNEENAGRVSEERAYLIRKGGAWYRPGSAGYTNNAHEAGLYTLEEAEDITHPNGPNGPRDAMSYHHRDTVAALALRAADQLGVRVTALEWRDWAQGGFIARMNDVLEYSIAKGARHYRVYAGKHKFLGAFETEGEAKAAAEDHYRNTILSCIEPLRPATEQAGGEVVIQNFDKKVLDILGDQRVGVSLAPASPPSPAATQSAVVSEELIPVHRIRMRTKLGGTSPYAQGWNDAIEVLAGDFAALSNPGASQ